MSAEQRPDILDGDNIATLRELALLFGNGDPTLALSYLVCAAKLVDMNAKRLDDVEATPFGDILKMIAEKTEIIHATVN